MRVSRTTCPDRVYFPKRGACARAHHGPGSRADVVERVARGWRETLPSFELPSRPWLGQEMTWHAFYLRGGVTFDSFFHEHIVDQASQLPGPRLVS